MLKTTTLNSMGSLLNVAGTPVYTYSSTTTSITINIPATTYTFTDNVNTLSVPAYNNTFSGLTASTRYYFDIAVDIPTAAYVVSNPSTSAFSAAQQLADCYRDKRVNVYSNYSVQTPASGTGGGSGGGGTGGGSCPADYQPIMTKEKGLVRADEVEIGTHLPAFGGGWNRVNEAVKLPAPIWRFTLANAAGERNSFDVNETHAVKTPDGEWLRVCDMKAGDKVRGANGDLVVVEARYVQDGHYIAFDADTHEYAMGDTCAHNATTL